MLYISILKLRGTKIIWTLHNSVEFTHHGKNKWLENILVRFLLDNVDNIIIHSKFQKEHLDKKYYDKIVWIAHHNYCSILKKDIRMIEKYFLFFGGIDKYKGLEIAIEAYKNSKMIRPFKIIGSVSNPEYKIKLMKLIDNEKNIIFEDRYVEDEELEQLVKNAHSVILPFKQITNSGTLIYALSCKTNIIISKSILTDELINNYKNINETIKVFETRDELSTIFDKNKKISLNSYDDFLFKTDIKNIVQEYKDIFR